MENSVCEISWNLVEDWLRNPRNSIILVDEFNVNLTIMTNKSGFNFFLSIKYLSVCLSYIISVCSTSDFTKHSSKTYNTKTVHQIRFVCSIFISPLVKLRIFMWIFILISRFYISNHPLIEYTFHVCILILTHMKIKLVWTYLRPNYCFSSGYFLILIILRPFFAHLFLIEFWRDRLEIWPQWSLGGQVGCYSFSIASLYGWVQGPWQYITQFLNCHILKTVRLRRKRSEISALLIY